MLITVTGGSGSGKSEMAEAIAQAMVEGEKLYIATMCVYDEESRKRIRKHRKQREGKHFRTLECPVHLEQAFFREKEDLILLECISNLTANEMYDERGTKFSDPQKTAEHIIKGIRHLKEQTKHLMIVTNEMFSEGTDRKEMREYLDAAGRVNRQLMEESDIFIESVYGLPVFWKESPNLTMEKGSWKWKKED